MYMCTFVDCWANLVLYFVLCQKITVSQGTQYFVVLVFRSLLKWRQDGNNKNTTSSVVMSYARPMSGLQPNLIFFDTDMASPLHHPVSSWKKIYLDRYYSATTTAAVCSYIKIPQSKCPYCCMSWLYCKLPRYFLL